MTRPKYFRKAIFLSLLIHLTAVIILTFALPKILPEKVLPPVEEFIIDVDLTAEKFYKEQK